MNPQPRERLQASDLRFLFICVALLAATTWFSVKYFYRAFPEASIDFRVNRDQSGGIAAQFLETRSLGASKFQHASRFNYDGDAKTFLERELGLEQANQVMGSKVRLWRWEHRWFLPRQKEELNVAVTPKGDVVGFAHLIAEADPRPSLDQPAARAVAEKFLAEVLHRDLAALEFVEGASTTRPARTDHVFTWQERGFDVKDARYRFELTVLGGEIGGFREYLKVPEQWLRDYETLRSRNEAAQTVDTALTVLLMIALMAMLVILMRRHDVRRRMPLLIGGTGAVLLFLSNWNSFPQREFGYPTTDSYGSFVAQQLLQNVLASIGAGLLLALLTAAAEPLYRGDLGRQLSLGNLFTFRGLRTRSFLRGSVLGITLTGIFVAYQIAFYLIAYRYGAWSPADVPYDDLLNTRFPWLYVLFGGFLPAISEEFLFRMFAIPFLKKVVRVTWIALFVAGFLWGFGHSGYPQQPFWIRGVEVGVGGVALGLVMLKWGILPTLVWHYSVDAMYTALLLARSESLYFKLSGLASAGIMLLPAAIAIFAYWRSGGFEPEEGLRNEDVAAPPTPAETPQAEPAAAATVAYTPMSRNKRLAALAVILIAAALAFLPVHQFGDQPRYERPEEAIRTAASNFVAGMGLKPDSYRTVAWPADRWSGPDSLAGKYMLERRALDKVDAMFDSYRPLHYWMVRYFRPLEKDEINVAVHPESTKILGFVHDLPEAAPGDDLSSDEARDIAAAFAAAHGANVQAMDLKESKSEKRKARRDHVLVWEAKSGDERNVEEARYRVEVTVSGRAVTAWRTYWKVPEAYERARSERNLLGIVLLILRIVVVIALAAGGVWWLVDATRKKELRWGRAVRWGLPLAALGLIGALLTLRQVYRNYDTTIPLGTFQTMMGAGLLMSVAGFFLMFCVFIALLLSLHPDAFDWLRKSSRRLAGIDAMLTALLAAALGTAMPVIKDLAQSWFPRFALPAVGTPDIIVSAFPALSAIAGAVSSSLTMLVVLAIVVRAIHLTSHRWVVIVAGLIALAGTLPPGVHEPGEFALYYVLRLCEVLVVVAVCLWIAHGNLLAYALTAWTVSLGLTAAELFAQHNGQLTGQAALLVVVLVAALACAAITGKSRDHLSLEGGTTP